MTLWRYNRAPKLTEANLGSFVSKCMINFLCKFNFARTQASAGLCDACL